jgi:putative transposase
VQFTAHAFTDKLEAANIRVSMDGRGRVFDNFFI